MKKKILIIIFLIICIIGTGYLAFNMYLDSMLNKTVTEEIDLNQIEVIEDNTPKAHEVVNIMLVGADSHGGITSYREERSDVFKIVSLDYTDKSIKLTSLDRDVVVYIPPEEEYGHFNWAYSYGGYTYALSTINHNLDLDLTKYVSFSFAGFIDVIDILGGIDIELTQAEADVINASPYRSEHVSEGVNHLDGKCALVYARIRKIDSDFYRMDRQSNVIKAVINKMKDSSLMDILDIINKCLPYISTNLTNDEIKKYVKDVLGFDLANIQTHTYPTNGSEDVCVNNYSLGGYLIRSYSNQVIDLHKYIYGIDDYKPTNTIYELEQDIYAKYGDFYEESDLLP